MKFCSQCSAPVALRIPEGDALPRYVCTACSVIHKVLLCRRAIEPKRGFWTLPAGFMENGETTFNGAMRETLEEANARVEIDTLYALYNIPHISQVYLLFRARLLDLDFSAGEETLELRLFEEAEIPWNEIAFAAVRNTLQHYFEDRRKGSFPFHMGTIEAVKA